MRFATLGTLCVASSFVLSACEKASENEVERAMDGVNVIDATNLNDIMLTVADPNEAVTYFKGAASKEPDRIDFQRGLAISLIRAGRPAEAVVVFERIVASDEVTNEDRVAFADALIRTNEWKQAKKQLDKIPPTFETYRRYRLEAMVADSNKDWKKSDSFYEIAAGLTTQPAAVLNNWGYSKLTRGKPGEAERLFVEAITADKNLFTSKNNLVLARVAQKKYTLPAIRMTQVERAQLLYTMALGAIKQGDVDIGRGLLREAIDTHPQHFEAAVNSLKLLQNTVSG